MNKILSVILIGLFMISLIIGGYYVDRNIVDDSSNRENSIFNPPFDNSLCEKLQPGLTGDEYYVSKIKLSGGCN